MKGNTLIDFRKILKVLTIALILLWVMKLFGFCALHAQEPTVETKWSYTHMQDDIPINSWVSNIDCIDSTRNIYPVTILIWQADTTVQYCCERGIDGDWITALMITLPAGDYAITAIYDDVWEVRAHSLYDGNGDGEIRLGDFGMFLQRIVGWEQARIDRELKCMLQLYGKSAVFTWKGE